MPFSSGQGLLTVSEKFLGRSCPYLHLSFTYSTQPEKIKIKTLSATYMWDPKREKKNSPSLPPPLSLSLDTTAVAHRQQAVAAGSRRALQQPSHVVSFSCAPVLCRKSTQPPRLSPPLSVRTCVAGVVHGQSQLEAQKRHLLSSPLPIECYL